MGFSVNKLIMKIKYSALVSDARGKLNGSVASKNRYGNYLRNKITPSNPQTTSQMRFRSLFGSISKNWGALTQSQRNAWDQFAEEHPFNDIFGDSKILQGSAMHQKSNMNLAKVNLPFISVPGEPISLPAIDLITVSLSILPVGTINLLEVDIGFSGQTVEDMSIVVYATPPVSAGRSFVKNDYRLIYSEQPDSAEPGVTMDVTSKYIEKYGHEIRDTDKVFVRVALLDNSNGLQSPAWEVEADV